jgi:hypothetical protein
MVTGVFPGSPGPALQFVGVETIVGESLFVKYRLALTHSYFDMLAAGLRYSTDSKKDGALLCLAIQQYLPYGSDT